MEANYYGDSELIRLKRINQKKLQEMRKKKVVKTKRRIMISVASVALVASLVLVNAPKTKKSIPDGYAYVVTSVNVEANDTLYGIAERYYNEAIYGAYYNNLNEYIKAICKCNNIDDANKITSGTNLLLPAILKIDYDSNNDLTELYSKLDELKETEPYIEYEVSYGDTLWDLACDASLTSEEIDTKLNELLNINKLKITSNLREGSIILIHNPAITELKLTIQELKNKNTTSQIDDTKKTMN